MRTAISIQNWIRKDHYLFFSKFEEPFFGVTVAMDCTKAYEQAKTKEVSFFLYYLYRALKAANELENFRYRIIDKEPFVFDKINASPTVDRSNGTFGFAYIDYEEDESKFYARAEEEIEQVRNSNGLFPAVSGENVIHFSALPWLDFTSISHARGFSFADSSPKISFGKISEKSGVKTMPVSIHVHHGLVDGLHVGLFVDRFQELLNA